MDTTTALALTREAIDLAGRLRHVFRGPPADRRIKELEDLLARIQTALQEAQANLAAKDAALAAKDKEIAGFKTAPSPKAEVIEKDGLTYEAKEGKAVGVPYCTRCYATDGRLIHLARLYPGNIEKCPGCGFEYQRLNFIGTPKIGG